MQITIALQGQKLTYIFVDREGRGVQNNGQVVTSQEPTGTPLS